MTERYIDSRINTPHLFDFAQILPTHPDHQLSQNELTELLTQVNFPQEIIGIDVNGTLVSESSPAEKNISPEDIETLKEIIAKKRAEGKAVFLVSDSPGPQLVELGLILGMDEGAIAELGNVIVWMKNIIVVNPLPEKGAIQTQIRLIAKSQGFQRTKDVIAPEFPGGKSIKKSGGIWAFGANRLASISVFGPEALIESCQEKLILPENTTADFNPQDGFLAIHPKIALGTDFTSNKSYTLAMLAQTGRQVTLIGNSTSDWTDPATRVRSMFVGGSRINEAMRDQAAYVSQEPLVKGVQDILQRI
jgi:sulfur carrier protein ThiS